MPFVSDTGRPTMKRAWTDDEDEDCRVHSSDTQHSFYRRQQHLPVTTSRKILPTVKRTRILEPVSPNYASVAEKSQQRQVRITAVSLAPCHICHRKPTKKAHLDAFAKCHGCGEQTCYVCVRECLGRYATDDTALSEQEMLSRSYHLMDAEESHLSGEEVECEPSAALGDQCNEQRLSHDGRQEKQRQIDEKGWNAGGHRPVVCSRCCVEHGDEGEVVCLGCLSVMNGV